MVELVSAMLVVLVASALCSCTEAAMFSIPVIKVRQMVHDQKFGAKPLLQIRESMNRPIATIVVFNNIANIVGTAVVGYLVTQHYGEVWLGVASGVLTLLIILFGEIVPKTLGEQYCHKIAPVMARPVLFVSKLLTPMLWCLEKAIEPLNKDETGFTTDEAEIKLMARMGQKEGIIGKDESEMIERVFELNDLTAADLLTPRVVMTYLWGEDTLEQARDQIIHSQHSRIVIVGKEVDDILGFTLKAELLRAIIEGHGARLISDFAKQVHFVPRQTKADALLLLFRRARQHLAVVLDEFGGVAGVVTLEDVLEVLTGEIMDETDQEEDLQKVAKQKRLRQRETAQGQKR